MDVVGGYRARGEVDGEAGGAPRFAHAFARRLTALPPNRMPGKSVILVRFELNRSGSF